MIVWKDPDYCVWCHPWASSFGVYIKAKGASQEQQAREQCSSMASVCVPALTPLVMEGDLRLYDEINPFLLKLLLDTVFMTAMESKLRPT